MREFQDHFSRDPEGYARYRPGYPPELFDWLASLVPSCRHAVDIACGTGQATMALAERFSRVTGLDASPDALEKAVSHPAVDYRVARAEETGLEPASADLVTVAQALHWFDQHAFHAEVRKILKPRGVLAAWTYERFLTGDPALDEIIEGFYRDRLGPYWPPERVHVENGYADLPFPLDEIEAPVLEMRVTWSLEQLLGYLGSWSALGRYRDAGHPDPLPELAGQLHSRWGTARRITWPLRIRAGRKPTEGAILGGA